MAHNNLYPVSVSHVSNVFIFMDLCVCVCARARARARVCVLWERDNSYIDNLESQTSNKIREFIYTRLHRLSRAIEFVK